MRAGWLWVELAPVWKLPLFSITVTLHRRFLLLTLHIQYVVPLAARFVLYENPRLSVKRRLPRGVPLSSTVYTRGPSSSETGPAMGSGLDLKKQNSTIKYGVLVCF